MSCWASISDPRLPTAPHCGPSRKRTLLMSPPPPVTPPAPPHCCLSSGAPAWGLVLRPSGGDSLCRGEGGRGAAASPLTSPFLALAQTYVFDIDMFVHLSKHLQPQITCESSCSHSPDVLSAGWARLRLSRPFCRQGCQGSETEGHLHTHAVHRGAPQLSDSCSLRHNVYDYSVQRFAPPFPPAPPTQT